MKKQEANKRCYLLEPQFPVCEELFIKQPAEKHSKTNREKQNKCKT